MPRDMSRLRSRSPSYRRRQSPSPVRERYRRRSRRDRSLSPYSSYSHSRRKSRSISPRRYKSRSPSARRHKSRSPTPKRYKRQRSRSSSLSPTHKSSSPNVGSIDCKNACEKLKKEEEERKRSCQNLNSFPGLNFNLGKEHSVACKQTPSSYLPNCDAFYQKLGLWATLYNSWKFASTEYTKKNHRERIVYVLAIVEHREKCSIRDICNERRQQEAELKLIEEETAKRVEEAILEKVEERLNSDEIKQEIQKRLEEGRRRLNDEVAIQLEKEKEVALLEARQKEEQARKEKEELEKMLEENRKRVEEAQRREALEQQRREEERYRELEELQRQKEEAMKRKKQQEEEERLNQMKLLGKNKLRPKLSFALGSK
ncbi:F-box family protein [Gossypium australe]|uniref:F-box family protein n=2 Tax=Gossypium TaxID=3633 RepID=A0A5B6V2R0_9ROSI|nr:F-box family protein [Gossypium australe]